MTRRRLIAWPAMPVTEPTPTMWVEAQLCRGQLELRYGLTSGPGSTAVLLAPSQGMEAGDHPGARRCDGLWQHTCFEAFVASPGSEAYWEFNLSPSGDWNVYRFDGYRTGQSQEEYYSALPFQVLGPHPAPPDGGGAGLAPGERLELALQCPLPPQLAQVSQLELGFTAVLEQPDGALSYWALHHPGPEPDFHDRRGWIVRL